ncbi:MAG TPA: VCBS repeat-containing protein [Kiritimatiellia bacterium]|nr:VCBS repeat-containing protein [Kiritimatiellia bacterium]
MIFYKMKQTSLLFATLIITWAVSGSHSVLGQRPELLGIGPEETLGPGRLPTIAADSSRQPHVVADGGSMIYLYDKIGGQWRSLAKNEATMTGSGQYYNPHIEIDSNDRAWVTGVLWGNNSFGLGLICRTDISTNPSDFSAMNRVRLAPVWDMGNLSFDPTRPNEVVVSSSDGRWRKYTYDATQPSRSRALDSGQMNAGQGGEKNAFWISKAGAVRHANGQTHSVWHGATGGWSPSPSAYQNSIRHAASLPRVIWASYNTYPTQGDDGTYVRVVSDNKDPQTAYITCDFSTGGKYANTAGVAMNIWDGGKMRFPSTGILVLDAAGSSGLRRFAPQSAPAKDGGVFVVWQRGGRVKMRFVPPDALSINDCGPEWDITAGGRPAISVDVDGNVHLAYVRENTLRYRLLQFDSFSSYVTLAADFNNDGRDDLALYDPKAGNWFIRQVQDGAGSLLAWYLPWGFSGATPVPGDYSGDGRADLAVYESGKGLWYIRSLNNSFIRSGIQWGYPGTIAVPGNYDRDHVNDLAVYAPRSGSWHVRSIAKSQQILATQWGFASGIPVPGDYNGNGMTDLAIFDTNNGDWYILNPDRYLSENTMWGFAGVQIVRGDFNGDGRDDLAVYDAASGRWYIRDNEGAVIAWAIHHGFPGTVAVPGDYNNNGRTDLAVYDVNNGRWFIRGLNGNIIAWNVDWGFPGAVPVAGDFNGDGVSDLAVYDPANGRWFIRGVNGNVLGWNLDWGGPGLQPVSGDFNGDGSDDLAVYAAINQRWFIRSLNGQVLAWNVLTGVPGGVPVSGDFNGNGRHDLAVYNPANALWYARTLTGATIMNGFRAGIPGNGSIPVAGRYAGGNTYHPGSFLNGRWTVVERGQTILWKVSWGWKGALPVAGDFNGDGRNDLAVYDEAGGNWYIRTVTGQVLAYPINWGFNPTIPVAGDFNGNGQSDLAVFGIDAGNWFIRTLGGTVIRWDLNWGVKGHIPIGSLRY